MLDDGEGWRHNKMVAKEQKEEEEEIISRQVSSSMMMMIMVIVGQFWKEFMNRGGEVVTTIGKSLVNSGSFDDKPVSRQNGEYLTWRDNYDGNTVQTFTRAD